MSLRRLSRAPVAQPNWSEASTRGQLGNLIGQSKTYLVSALKRYSSGARKNAIMAGITKAMSDSEIENVAAYYAAATCK